jgi:hypothetical protein
MSRLTHLSIDFDRVPLSSSCSTHSNDRSQHLQPTTPSNQHSIALTSLLYHNMSQEQDPFAGGEGDEDETLIMAPLLVEKLQVSSRAGSTVDDWLTFVFIGSWHLLVRHQETERSWLPYRRSCRLHTQKTAVYG